MDIDFAPLFQRWYELNFEKSLGYTLQKFTSSLISKKKTSKSKSIKSFYISMLVMPHYIHISMSI